MARRQDSERDDRRGYLVGTLSLLAQKTVGDVTVRQFAGDMQYRGYQYVAGMRVVEAKNKDGSVHTRRRTFKGEMAWADGERMYGDLVHELKMAEPWDGSF